MQKLEKRVILFIFSCLIIIFSSFLSHRKPYPVAHRTLEYRYLQLYSSGIKLRNSGILLLLFFLLFCWVKILLL